MSEALPLRLYGLPTIHKEDVAFRPIVSTINSPTYSLINHLADLKSHAQRTDSFVWNLGHFIEKVQNISLGPEDILVRFDVVSLFTMVPIRGVIEYIQQLYSRYDDVVSSCANYNVSVLQVGRMFYEQTDGVAMESPLSPVVANVYMEKRLFKPYGSTPIRFEKTSVLVPLCKRHIRRL